MRWSALLTAMSLLSPLSGCSSDAQGSIWNISEREAGDAADASVDDADPFDATETSDADDLSTDGDTRVSDDVSDTRDTPDAIPSVDVDSPLPEKTCDVLVDELVATTARLGSTPSVDVDPSGAPRLAWRDRGEGDSELELFLIGYGVRSEGNWTVRRSYGLHSTSFQASRADIAWTPDGDIVLAREVDVSSDNRRATLYSVGNWEKLASWRHREIEYGNTLQYSPPGPLYALTTESSDSTTLYTGSPGTFTETLVGDQPDGRPEPSVDMDLAGDSPMWVLVGYRDHYRIVSQDATASRAYPPDGSQLSNVEIRELVVTPDNTFHLLQEHFASVSLVSSSVQSDPWRELVVATSQEPGLSVCSQIYPEPQEHQKCEFDRAYYPIDENALIERDGSVYVIQLHFAEDVDLIWTCDARQNCK